MNQVNRSALDNDNVGQLLLQQSLPAFIANIVTTTYNIVNTIFVGHYVGALGIAGITIVQPVLFLSIGIGNMFGIGGASLISRAIGAGNREKAERTLSNAISGVTIISIIILIAGLAGQDFWLRTLGATEGILPYARDYFIVILFGLFFQTLALSLASLTRAEGSARVAMVSMALGGISNIIFDAFFIIFLRMGVRGAAIGTVIAQFLTVVYFGIFYFRGQAYLKIRLKYFVIKWEFLKEILKIGFANFIMSFTSGTSNLILNRALVTYGGDIGVAAYGVCNRLLVLSMLPGQAIGQGLQPILGFNYGTKRYDRAYRALKIALFTVVIIGIVCFILLYFFPDVSLRMFTNDAELLNTSVYVAKHVYLAVALTGCIITALMTFQALGNIIKSYIITLRPVIFMLPLVLILPRFFHLTGVVLAFPVTEALTFVLSAILLIPTLREFRRLGRTTAPVENSALLSDNS